MPEPLLLLPPDPEEAKLGPAMRALDHQRRLFVQKIMETGTNDFGQAAADAGWEGSASALKSRGYRLSHEEAVQKAFAEEARKRLNAHAPLASTVLVNIIGSTTETAKDKLKAIEMLFNRIGMHEMREEKHVVEVHTVDDNELIRQARALVKEMNLSAEEARKMLGDRYEEIIEGEFKEVDPVLKDAPKPTWMTEEEIAQRMLEEALR